MIRFPCRCTHIFEVAEDQAGGVIQCPDCGRLNDIPTLSDLASLTDDGTYKLDAPNDPKELDRLAKLQRTFAKQRVDDAGDEIDLRITMDEIAAASSIEVPLDLRDEIRPGAPKYDPVTGELVRPIDVKKDPQQFVDPASIPLAKAVVQYASGATATRLGAGKMLLDLFNLPSTIVIFSIFFAHAFLQLAIISSLAGFFFVVPVVFIGLGLIIGHYANVIDETGPSQRDDLPRLFREMSWHDDLWGSFVRFVFAIMVCYLPLLMIGRLPLEPSIKAVTWLLWLMIGSFLFPAVLLTTTTSGSWINLRPDRVWAVITALGGKYFLAVLAWVVASLVYIAGFIGTNLALAQLFQKGYGAQVISGFYWLAYPILLAGIYLMHAYCWYLGLLYRKHHEEFGWLLQRFVKEAPTPAARRANFNILPKGPPRAPSPAAPPPQPVQPLNTPIDAAAAARRQLRPRGPAQ